MQKNGPAASQLIESPRYPWRHTWRSPWKLESMSPSLHLKKRVWVRWSVSRAFSIRPYVWWFYVGNLKHQVWLNILKDGLSSKFVLKFCSWVFLKWTLTQRGPVMPPVQSRGARTGLPRAQLAAVCMSASRLCFKRSFYVGPGFLFSIVPLFSFSLTFSLHADKSLCFTSPKTPSSSWVSHLSALRSWSLLQLTLFSLLASCLWAGHTLRFLLYRSSSVQCKINTV